MPLAPPVIDDRRYPQLVDETLARAAVHTPEWTNFNQSDPGVTLVQLFAFLTENLLYRANLIPERNEVKFLQLLRVPLQPAQAARGLVSIQNERGPLRIETLDRDLEVRAGAVPFRTQRGLDVLPIEARVFFKRPLAAPPAELVEYYRLLYASYQTEFPSDVKLYETVALDPKVLSSVDINQDSVDRSLWVALLARSGDVTQGLPGLVEVRKALEGRTLSLGVVPALDATVVRRPAGGSAQPGSLLVYELPRVAASGRIERDTDDRPRAAYRQLTPRGEADVLAEPGVVELALPSAAELDTWRTLDPLEAGVGNLPPTLDDSTVADRVVTWLRIRAAGAAQARVKWVGINTVAVEQLEHIVAEPLADGDGSPDQTRRLARAPVLAGTIEVVTRLPAEDAVMWREVDDLDAAPAEVPVRDPRLPPGMQPSERRSPAEANVFSADHEAGALTFGDGLRGRRLPAGARVFASYDFCEGAAGNVAERSINAAPLLPSGFSVLNHVRTWGGADAESVPEARKQIKRHLQHRDRLVSVEDFESIAWRAPGLQIGRIEVLPAYDPDLDPIEPGAAPGAVTVLAIPRFDAEQPDAPRADRLFLRALCAYLEPRRLVTTELIVRGPVYKGIWISVGIDVAAGFAVAEVVEAVTRQLRKFLAPIGPAGYEKQSAPLFTPRAPDPRRGWLLRAPVSSRVLLAETARVPGVTSVAGVQLAEGALDESDVVEMSGLDLPRVLGISVVAGEPVPISALRGDSARGAAPPEVPALPVPIVPETC